MKLNEVPISVATNDTDGRGPSATTHSISVPTGEAHFTLRPYQHETLNASYGKPAFMNLDDPGLGKTVVQAIEIAKLGAKTNLIACPVTAMGVWEWHLKQLVPGIEILKWPQLPEYGCTTLISIDNVSGRRSRNPGPGRPSALPRPELMAMKWDMFVIDEAHSIKNRNAKRSKVARKLRRRYQMLRLLSGTLPDNRPDELWHPLHMGWPMDFGSYNAFYEQFCAYEVDQYGFKHVTGPNNVAELQHLLYGEGRAVRHVRTEVLPEIPGKYYTYYPIDMTHKQRRAYNEMRDQQLAWIGALGDEPIAAPVAIAKLIRMGQFASAYAEFNDEGKLRLSEPSNKLDALMEILEGRRLPVVVFSVSTQLLALAARRMAAKGYRVGTIQGGVPEAKRTELARMFQAGELDILLCQTRAGGVSITLTRASTAIMLDRDWAPGANSQGEDRLDRWGQLEKVEVIILQSTGTVDMRKERTVQTKKGWIKEMLDDRH